MDKIGERIAFLRGKETRKNFADRIGVPANTLRNYESGISLPNSEFIAKICSELKINPYWLLYGLSNGIEYPINADDMLPSRPPQANRPKVGNYTTLTRQLDIFSARTSSEFTDALKRNLPLYKRISFAYYEAKKNSISSRGYALVVIGENSLESYDIYDTKTLCTNDDFFIVELVSVLSVIYKNNIPLYEIYTTEDSIVDLIDGFANADLSDPVDVCHLVDMTYYFFEKQIETPSILYGFHEVPPSGGAGPDEVA